MVKEKGSPKIGHEVKVLQEQKQWNDYWSHSSIDPYRIVNNCGKSARWKKVEERILSYFGSFKNLDVIELGSGIGTESLLMALRGANVTLVDYSETALQTAKQFYNFFNFEPNIVKANILNLGAEYFGKFDVSSSFGTVEHFLEDSERQEAINAYFRVLKRRGISFISVPNRVCPHYMVHWLIRKGLSKFIRICEGKPFTKRELIDRAKEAGFNRCEIFGSSLFDLSYVTGYYGEFKTILDDYFAAAIVLFAIK